MPDGVAAPVIVTPSFDLSDFRFPLKDGDFALLTISLQDGTTLSFKLQDSQYASMLQALTTVSDPLVEAKILDVKNNPSLPKLYRYRLANWVAANLLQPGYKAQPV